MPKPISVVLLVLCLARPVQAQTTVFGPNPFTSNTPFAGTIGTASVQLSYATLDYGMNSTFLTGIRGNNIVGNYVIPGTTSTGGLLYSASNGLWTLFPVQTANGASYPGATGSSPYGPGFGSPILKAVGSYKTAATGNADLSYFSNGAAPPAGQLTDLGYPGTSAVPVLNTIAHSTFGDQIVGNYDTGPLTGNAFVYTISSGTYRTNNFPGALSTTAYGVYGDKIAGGYTPPGLGFERGYIYDQSSGSWTTYNHPGAVFTHFEGITGAGRGGAYNLVADWAGADGVLHAAVLHIAADGTQTWINYGVPGALLTSANSIYQNEAVGIYVDAGGGTHGYVVSIPGIYDPIANSGVLNLNTANAPALLGGIGDDIVNSGSIRTTASNSSGVRGDSFGTITNNGTINVIGSDSSGVEMRGVFGTLQNAGSIVAAPDADAIRTATDAVGTTIVNTGTIDGRVSITAGPTATFENSGWLGTSAAGAGTANVISGNFLQSSTGTLAVRLGSRANDSFQIGGAASLDGALAPLLPAANRYTPSIGQQFQIISAANGIYGSFASLTQPGGLLAGTRFDTLYGATTVNLVVTPSSYASFASNSWSAPVGAALDSFRPPAGVAMTPDQAAVYAPLYSLSGSQILPVLRQLAPVVYSDEQMVNRSTFQMVTNSIASELRARRGAPALVGSDHANGPGGATIWLSGSGQFVNLNSSSNGSPGYNGSSGGVIAGIDGSPTPGARFGFAVGFNRQSLSTANAADYSGQSVQLQPYASFSHDIMFLDAQAGIVFNQGTAHRTLAAENVTTTGDVSGTGYGGSLRGGVRLDVGGWHVEPSLTLSGLSMSQGSFTESGGGPVGVAVQANSIASLQTLVGVEVYHRFWIGETYAVVPSVQVGWAYETMDTQARTTANFLAAPSTLFTVSNPSIGRNAAIVGLHAVLETGMRLQVFAGYDAGLNGTSSAQNIKGGIRYSF